MNDLLVLLKIESELLSELSDEAEEADMDPSEADEEPIDADDAEEAKKPFISAQALSVMKLKMYIAITKKY